MPLLGYWNIRGIAHPIRFLLEYTGTEYEEKRYETGDPPEFMGMGWHSIKYSLGLDFPNLPYYVDGSVKLTQSNAIIRYIARQHNLCGGTEEEKMRVDTMENQVDDFRWGMINVLHNRVEYEHLRKDYLQNLPNKIREYSEYLGKRPWFAGDKITYVDFMAYEALDAHRSFAPSCLENFSNLQEFLARFETLPKIAEYMKSDRFISYPYFAKVSMWGSSITKDVSCS